MKQLSTMFLMIFAIAQISYAQEKIIIKGGTLVDVREGYLTEGAVITIHGDRIVSVSNTDNGTLSKGISIDATGKYILPGLIDLHIHYDDWAGELYLNHGVTTVVDLGNVYEWIKAQKRGIESGLIPGPRLFHATENLDGPTDRGLTKRVVRTITNPKLAKLLMSQYIKDGVDAVKVYDQLSEEVLRVIVAEAKKDNLPVIGHFKDVRVAARVGAHGIEHTNAVANAIVDEPSMKEAKKRVRQGFPLMSQFFMDSSKLPGIVELMVKNNLYLNPTFRGDWAGDRSQLEKGFHYEDFDLLINDWRLRYVPLAFRMAAMKEYQEIGVWNWRDLSLYERNLFNQGYQNTQRLVKTFVEAGGKLYAGTDSAHLSTPGLSMHQELELMVDAGISPLKALQAATINSAELMRMTDRLGTLEKGKVGDVIILDANPLENIRNTRKIWKVISRGKILDLDYHADFKNPLPRNYPEDSSHYFPSPEIQAVSPEVLESGEINASLTVTGTGFIPYSLVRLDGIQLPTKWVNSFELQADVADELLQPGTHAISVENPDFAGGTVSPGWHVAHLGLRSHISNNFLILVPF